MLKKSLAAIVLFGAASTANAGLISLNFDGTVSSDSYIESDVIFNPVTTTSCAGFTSVLCIEADPTSFHMNGDLFDLNSLFIEQNDFAAAKFIGNTTTQNYEYILSEGQTGLVELYWTGLTSVDIILGDASSAFVRSQQDTPTLVISSMEINRVPEPTSLALIGAGLLGFGARKLMKKSS